MRERERSEPRCEPSPGTVAQRPSPSANLPEVRMHDPVLLAVEEDPTALADVERELRDRYARSYRIICTRSPDDALEELTRLAEAREEVALVLAAQWLS